METGEILEYFLNERGLYWKFKEYVEDRGFDVSEFGIIETNF